MIGENTSLLTDMYYNSTCAESDMYNPSHSGRLPACDVPITNGYTRVDANLHRIVLGRTETRCAMFE
jgi:hypothetical protein